MMIREQFSGLIGCGLALIVVGVIKLWILFAVLICIHSTLALIELFGLVGLSVTVFVFLSFCLQTSVHFYFFSIFWNFLLRFFGTKVVDESK